MSQMQGAQEGTTAGQSTLTNEHFQELFPSLKALIRKEWPEIDASVLDSTHGDLDRTIDLVARKTEQSRAAVRRQLSELVEIVQGRGMEARLNRIVAALEDRSKQVMDMIRDDLVPKAEETMRTNLWKSLVGALGVGLVLGLVFGMQRGR